MPIFQFGPIIKKRRQELGYSQEELADGICSVPTLSRIENGDRMPSKEHFEMLIQRLGYSNTTLDCYVDEKEFYIHELKFKIRQAIMLKQMDEAEELLQSYEKSVETPTQIDKQFLILSRILIHPQQYNTQQRLEWLEKAIRLTCPKYESNKLPILLSYEEIILLNDISICYFLLGDCNRAIRISSELKKYYDNHIINSEEALRTQPMVLYNLSKFLGTAGRYDESIEISDLGIRIAKETGRCSMLAMALYNRAWAMVKRGQPQDMDTARQSAREAYYMASIMGQTNSAERYRKFIRETFSEEISL